MLPLTIWKRAKKRNVCLGVYMGLLPHAQAHFIVFMVFTIIYFFLMRDGHFKSEIAPAPDALDPILFAVQTHTLLGDSTMKAATRWSRLATSLHAFLAWILAIAITAHLVGSWLK